MKNKRIKKLDIIDYSGFNPKPGAIETMKRNNYYVQTDISMTGDAPKDFIRYYHYGENIKSNKKTWNQYIAKLGHKHYPNESITEYLLNRIGESLGFNMAKFKLVWAGEQIRFLSKYFLTKTNEQVLEHGADLYAGYLNDKDFVEDIEKSHKSPDFFTVQFTEETIKYFFPKQCEELMFDFLKVLIFDAFIGNNDRHFYNWGIIRNIYKKEEPTFSPVYDTARGLYWNYNEQKIKAIYEDKNRLYSHIEKYSNESRPKIGWEGEPKINHFKLLEKICTLDVINNCGIVKDIIKEDKLGIILDMIDKEFSLLFSKTRREMIKLTLQYRFKHIEKSINFAV